MSRLFANNGRLDGDFVPPSNDVTVACWMKRSAAATDYLVHLGPSSSVDGIYLLISSAGVMQAGVSAASSGVAASATPATISDTTIWHLGVGSSTGATSTTPVAYLEGVNKGTQPASRTPTGVVKIRIGQRLDGSNAFSGRIAHVAVWSPRLTDAEVAQLATNLPSAVRPDKLIFYAPLIENRSPEIDDVGGVDLALTNATYDTDNPPIGPPVITDVGTVQKSASLTIGGLLFKPGATNPTVTIGGVAQTVNSATDTSITINAVTRGTAKYGDQPVTVTNSLGLSDSQTVPFIPPTGYAYVDLIAPLALIDQRLTALPELAGGDQIEYGNVVGGVIGDGQVLSDASFLWDQDVTAFDVSVWDQNDGSWSAFATQTLEEPTDPPVLTGVPIPPLYYTVGEEVSFSLADYATGWDTIAVIGTLPTGLSVVDGVITGTTSVHGVFAVFARYTNADPLPTDSNVFRVIEGRKPSRQITTTQASPRRRRFLQ